MADDPTTFIDPNPNPEDHPPTTTGAMIAEVRFDLIENLIWEVRDGKILCHACAPGGYAIRADASPESHAASRNPDTHRKNLIWLVIQSFVRQGKPIPAWPDAYHRTKQGLAWCYICEARIGFYREDTCVAHDVVHRAWTQTIMRPSRLIGRERERQANRGAVGRPRKRVAWFEEVINARVGPAMEALRPVAEETAGELGPSFREIIQATKGENFIILDGEMLFHDDLDKILDDGRTYACSVKNLHDGIQPRSCQRPEVCSCYCHRPFGGSA